MKNYNIYTLRHPVTIKLRINSGFSYMINIWSLEMRRNLMCLKKELWSIYSLNCDVLGLWIYYHSKKRRNSDEKDIKKTCFIPIFYSINPFYSIKNNGEQLFAHEIDFWTLVDKNNYFNENCSNALILYFKSLYEDV